MSECRLGPNGGLVYAMEYLVDNFDWLEVRAGAQRAWRCVPHRTLPGAVGRMNSRRWAAKTRTSSSTVPARSSCTRICP
eukprot:6851628-Prymnesium_polylepis.1